MNPSLFREFLVREDRLRRKEETPKEGGGMFRYENKVVENRFYNLS